MMALSNLLNNQTIVIDDHHRGGNKLEWGNNLHIHKRMNKGSKSSLDCEIYFAARNRPIVFSNEKGNDVDKIKNEILDAFSSNDIRKRFIESFYDAVNPILSNGTGKAPSDIIRIVRRGVKRIAKSFGLSDEIQNAMIDNVEHYHMYRTEKYYIGLKDDEFKVVMGDDDLEVMNLLK